MAIRKVALNPWHVLNAEKNPTECVLFLPGRDNSGSVMGKTYDSIGLDNTLLVSITPKKLEWYPLPNGINDQDAAVEGLSSAYETIESVVDKITETTDIRRNKIVLCGYSAGGVMGIQVAVHSKEPFAGVVVHCGAILEPSILPKCQCPDTPFLLTHYKDDPIFEWEERYLPMKKALIQQRYAVWVLENSIGGHLVDEPDLIRSRFFIQACFKGMQHAA